MRTEISLVLQAGWRRGAILLAGGQRIDDGFERLVFDLHQLGGVFRDVAGFGDDESDRLAGKAHVFDGERPLMHGLLERNQERIGELADVFAGDHRGDARQRQGRGRVDAEDLRMRVRRADHMAMERAVWDRQIIRIASAPRQQRRVFLANERTA